VCDHPRNVPDDVLARMPVNGGVVMAVFLGQFVSQAYRDHALRAEEAVGEERAARRAWLAANPGPPVSLTEVADHIDRLRDVAGIDHVGIGSDFDGGEPLPEGLTDVGGFPALLAELLRRGYSDADVRAIAGGNLLRTMRDAEAVAARLQVERAPSEATIEDLDGPS
jgi:membrane dipeptidase